MNTQTDTLNDLVRQQRDAIEVQFRADVSTLTSIATEFGMAEIEHKLQLQISRLVSTQLEIMVGGRFKVGKSTFLNALLASTHYTLDLGDAAGPLPVDQLPCTAVLTRVEYADEPCVRAIQFDGGQEDWTFARYVAEAKIYGETIGDAERFTDGGRLADIASFIIGLPVELLRTGLVFIDSPGISEDPRRTASTRKALGSVHAAVVMFRNDMLAGEDELDFAAEALAQAGHVFPMVNMFYGQPVTDRLKAVLAQRLARLQDVKGYDKLDHDTAYVDCQRAFNGYASNDPDLVRASGIQALEQALGAFVINNGYRAKVRGAADGALGLAAVIGEDLDRQSIALRADQDRFQAALRRCNEDLQEIRVRRGKVEAILDRANRRAVVDATESYRMMCQDLHNSIESCFAERPLLSLATPGGKVLALATRKAAREAGKILQDIIQEHVQAWAETAPTAPRGLQRDLWPGLQDARRELQAEYDGIDAKLRDISLRIGELDPEVADAAPVVTLQERLVAAGLGMVVLGPVGLVVGTTGWRGAVGATLAVVAAKAGLALVAGAFGLALAPAVLIGLIFSAVLGGAVAGGVYDIEARIRKKALEAIRPKLRSMMTDETAIESLKQSVQKSMGEDGAQVLAALDVILQQQEQSLASLKAANGHSLEDKRVCLTAVSRALAALATIRQSLATLDGRVNGSDTALLAA